MLTIKSNSKIISLTIKLIILANQQFFYSLNILRDLTIFVNKLHHSESIAFYILIISADLSLLRFFSIQNYLTAINFTYCCEHCVMQGSLQDISQQGKQLLMALYRYFFYKRYNYLLKGSDILFTIQQQLSTKQSKRLKEKEGKVIFQKYFYSLLLLQVNFIKRQSLYNNFSKSIYYQQTNQSEQQLIENLALSIAYNFIMQIQGEQLELKQNPFEIIYNARTSRPSRSRKSSVSIVDKDKPIPKMKKLRKMTMNPQSIRFQQIREIEELNNEQKGPCSQRGDIKEESMNIDDFLELDIPHRLQSQKEQQLQKGILLGICNERELNSDFDLSGSHQNFRINEQIEAQ